MYPPFLGRTSTLTSVTRLTKFDTDNRSVSRVCFGYSRPLNLARSMDNRFSWFGSKNLSLALKFLSVFILNPADEEKVDRAIYKFTCFHLGRRFTPVRFLAK